MPGPVQQYVEAVKEVETYADRYDQPWDVREAFDDNLRVERQFHPEESYSLAVRHAIETTKHEIRDNAEIEEERESERLKESHGYRMRL